MFLCQMREWAMKSSSLCWCLANLMHILGGILRPALCSYVSFFNDISATAAQVILRILLFQHPTSAIRQLSVRAETHSGACRRHCCWDGAKMYFKKIPVALIISSSIENQSLVTIQIPLLAKAHKAILVACKTSVLCVLLWL